MAGIRVMWQGYPDLTNYVEKDVQSIKSKLPLLGRYVSSANERFCNSKYGNIIMFV